MSDRVDVAIVVQDGLGPIQRAVICLLALDEETRAFVRKRGRVIPPRLELLLDGVLRDGDLAVRQHIRCAKNAAPGDGALLVRQEVGLVDRELARLPDRDRLLVDRRHLLRAEVVDDVRGLELGELVHEGAAGMAAGVGGARVAVPLGLLAEARALCPGSGVAAGDGGGVLGRERVEGGRGVLEAVVDVEGAGAAGHACEFGAVRGIGCRGGCVVVSII